MTTNQGRLAPLTPLGSKYLRYLLSFVVTLSVGLLPLWGGKLGFTAILDVFPRDLQGVVIPWASLLISITAVGVQFFGGDATHAHWLKRAFAATFMLLVVLVFVLFAAYQKSVVRVEVPGAHSKIAYVVGKEMVKTCACLEANLPMQSCIGRAISVNPDDVSACYPPGQISDRNILLSVLYMAVMFSLGLLIGLLVLKEALPATTRRKPRAAPRPVVADEPPPADA